MKLRAKQFVVEAIQLPVDGLINVDGGKTIRFSSGDWLIVKAEGIAVATQAELDGQFQPARIRQQPPPKRKHRRTTPLPTTPPPSGSDRDAIA